ncbi:hypothetical protein Tsubulata_013351, partial [Turnera subulata]
MSENHNSIPAPIHTLCDWVRHQRYALCCCDRSREKNGTGHKCGEEKMRQIPILRNWDLRGK